MAFQLLLSMFWIPRFCVPVDETSKGFDNKIEVVSGLKRVFDCINKGPVVPFFYRRKTVSEGCSSPEYFEISKP